MLTSIGAGTAMGTSGSTGFLKPRTQLLPEAKRPTSIATPAAQEDASACFAVLRICSSAICSGDTPEGASVIRS